MAARGRYFDGCPSAHALDLIGDRWALLVVRELLLGPKRFTDLRLGLPRISRNVLSQRLDDLETAGVLERRTLPPPAATAVYELTPRGLELESVLNAIGRWGARSSLLPESDSVGVDTFVLGLRARFDAQASRGIDARYELRVGREAFDFLVQHGRLTVRRGPSPPPAVMVEVIPGAMAAVARGARPVRTALSAPGATTEDDLVRFAALFRDLQFGAAA
ncbi:MAG: winged helix-turn-helix transcriptional regulator [Solirubrobacteraceae bacterium]